MPVWELALRILGAIVALAFVLYLAWVIIRWLNRRLPGMSGGAARHIKVLDRVSIGKGSSILLVRVQDKVLLVGASDHAFEKLAEFDDPEHVMDLQGPAELPSFSQALKDAVKKMGKGSGDAPDGAENPDKGDEA